MNLYMIGLIWVLAATAIAIGGMLLVRKRVGIEKLLSYHEVAGYMLSVVGTLYAVLLGFVVVDAMQHTQELRVLVDQEASGLANIYLCANGLPSDKRLVIQNTCREYADVVVNDEWARMSSRSYSPEAFRLVWSLWTMITTYDPVTERQQILSQQLTSEICSMTQNRRTRIVSASHGINPLMWGFLNAGAVLTIMFTYFFGVENVKAQALMTLLVSLTISLNVFLAFVFSHPFVGDFAVQADSFKLDQMIFQNYEHGTAPPPPAPARWP